MSTLLRTLSGWALLVCVSTGAVCAQEPEPFEIPDTFSIATPDNEFKWELERTIEYMGVKAEAYICRSPNSKAAIVLMVQHQTAKTDGERAANVKGHVNGLVDQFTAGGFTNIKLNPPKRETPLPDRVTWSVTATNPEGLDLIVNGVTIFGVQTVMATVASPSKEELEKLMKVIDSYQEPAVADAAP